MSLKIGSYQILRTLGQGAHSKIMHIRRNEDSKHYALKVVSIDCKDDRKYYLQACHEFRVAKMLDHANLIKVYALETERNWLFRVKKVHLLIEFVNGKTIDLVQGLTIPHLVQLFAYIAAGLTHMHRRGVCHADLKPSNILLSRTGEVRIIDYGLAWIKGEAKGRVQGTPEYMAPEQSRQGTVNEQTDIYNLGATMYRLVTGQLPPSTLPAPGSPAINAKLFKNLIKPVQERNPAVPESLAALIHRCLKFQPERRPERVGIILEELNVMVNELVRSPEDQLGSREW